MSFDLNHRTNVSTIYSPANFLIKNVTYSTRFSIRKSRCEKNISLTEVSSEEHCLGRKLSAILADKSNNINAPRVGESNQFKNTSMNHENP